MKNTMRLPGSHYFISISKVVQKTSFHYFDLYSIFTVVLNAVTGALPETKNKKGVTIIIVEALKVI